MSATLSPRQERIAEFREEWLNEYRARTPRSFELFANPRVTRIPEAQRFYYSSGLPYNLEVDRAEGAYIYDIDGNRYLDWIAGWNSGVLGFGNERVVAAVTAAMQRFGGNPGDPFPVGTKDQVAELIASRIPGIELVFFCLSGADAAAYAIRVARAHTGRDKILKFTGAYHGVYDDVLVGSFDTAGIPANTADNVLNATFNDRAGTARLIAEHAHELAAVLAEPMMTSAGNIEQHDGFLQFLRDETRKQGVLLILDEAITGFRFAQGGAGEYYGITPAPDLTCLAKMLGGGLPLAAVGGSATVMSTEVVARNTHAGNPICHAAALACLQELTPDIYLRMNALGAGLRAGLRAMLSELGLNLQVTGDSTNCGLHMIAEEVRDAETARRADFELYDVLRLGMVNAGFNWTSRGIGVTAAITSEHVDETIRAFRSRLLAMRPLIEEVAPHLVGAPAAIDAAPPA
jgi:glutamate-1-semialdehyde 2,1-aminomutase